MQPKIANAIFHKIFIEKCDSLTILLLRQDIEDVIQMEDNPRDRITMQGWVDDINLLLNYEEGEVAPQKSK